MNRSGKADETAVRALFRLDSLFLSHQGERKRQLKPNPATNQLNFNYLVEDAEPIEFLLYDVLGKLQLRTKLLAGDQHRINLTDLNKGVYLYRMTNSAEGLKSGKLIIE